MMRALVVAPVLALLLVAGCSSPTPAAPATTVTVPPSPAAPAPSATTPTPATTPTTSPASAQPAAGPCELPDLGAELTRPAGDGTQGSVRVVWTNTSGTPCTIRGFGGVDLQRDAAAHAGLPPGQRSRPDRFSAARTDRPAEAVRLEPGEHAHTTITYVPLQGSDPDAFVPTQVLATPPDETRSAVLTWTGGGVLDANPGAAGTTYLEPVRPGAS